MRVQSESVLALHPDYYIAYLPRAIASLVSHRYQDATAAYDEMAAIGSQAHYLADIGRVDLAIARGDYPGAIELLRKLISDGVDSSRSLVLERFWLASAQWRSGDEADAIKTIDVIDESTLRNEELLQLGELLVVLGRLDAAGEVAEKLRDKLRDVPRAYGDLLAAQVAWSHADYLEAIDLLNDVLKRSDMWYAHFVLGRVYLDAGLYPEAIAEFGLCLDRNGEAVAVFLDDIPTYHRLVEVHYWYARALQEIGQVEPAARAYQDYMDARDLAATDRSVAEARRRLKELVSL